ncbi:hypothetical protein HOY82DRAFT_595315 [Tuber indicum]|nr:hypothetical protein HOY82DRAFT_595315 [Tuber indicum]
MSLNRTSIRDSGAITEATFLDMLGISIWVMYPIRVQERTSCHIAARTSIPLERGVYDIYCKGPIEVSDESWVEHEVTRNVTGRNEQFRHEVPHIQTDNWYGFEACHIFPLKHETLWDELRYGRWITDIQDTPSRAKINSSQNGLLLQSTIHQIFDKYLISVNPHYNYKIVVFDVDMFGLGGRILDHACRNPGDPHHVPRELLEWHFKQSVLVNVRGP